MRLEVIVKTAKDMVSLAKRYEQDLLQRSGHHAPGHFAHVVNTYLTPIVSYSELAEAGLPFRADKFKEAVHGLIGYLKLLKHNEPFALAEISNPKGMFTEYGDFPASEYVARAKAALGSRS